MWTRMSLWLHIRSDAFKAEENDDDHGCYCRNGGDMYE